MRYVLGKIYIENQNTQMMVSTFFLKNVPFMR